MSHNTGTLNSAIDVAIGLSLVEPFTALVFVEFDRQGFPHYKATYADDFQGNEDSVVKTFTNGLAEFE